jgi:hypothetical protein
MVKCLETVYAVTLGVGLGNFLAADHSPCELGYEVTMVRDATADYSEKEMHAALDVNIPSYASL